MKKFVLLFAFVFATYFANAQHAVTINVDMSGVTDFDPATRELDWAGGFDGWAAFHTMEKTADNIYSITFTDVPSGYYAGDIYQNDLGSPDWGTYGEWSGAPTGLDIRIYVGDEDITFNTKWGETYVLTVDVDMNNVDGFTPGTDSVFFINEDTHLNNTPMLDENADGVYTVTFNGVPSIYLPTVFAFGPDRDNLTPEWNYATNTGNRVIVVDGADTQVSYVYSEAGSPVMGHNVTINVDMSGVADFDPASRELDWAGSFDGWAAFHGLEKTSDNIYSVTFTDVPSGYYTGDVYQNDLGSPDWGTYGEWSGGPTGIDIMVYVGDEDVTLTTKWGETYNLNVSVNMNNVDGFTPGSDSVFFISKDISLNNTPLLDDNSDGIYSYTFTDIPSGYFPAVFAYGTDRENLTPEWDYTTNTGNRVIVVGGSDGTVSYEFSNGMPLASVSQEIIPELSIFPNPVTGNSVSYSVNKFDFSGGTAIIMDLTGRVIIRDEISSTNGSINVATLNSGIYLLRLSLGKKSVTKKLIVR
jgi:hypothetical protein